MSGGMEATWRAPGQAPAPKLDPQKATRKALHLSDHVRELVAREVAKAYPDLWAHLFPEGQHRFVSELLHAERDGEKAVESVVEAWYRTLWLRQDPDYEDHMAADMSREKSVRTPRELRQKIGL